MKPFLAVVALALGAPTAYALPVVQRSSVTVDVIGSGGYQATYYKSPTIIVPEVHLLGVYQAIDGSVIGNPQGTARVNVQGSAVAPVHLALSSYEPVKWILEGPGRQYVASVLVNSIHPSIVEGIDASKIINRTGSQWLGAYGYAWPSASGGSNTPLLASRVATHFGAPISTFAGAYSASKFTVNLAPVPEPTAVASSIFPVAAIATARRRLKSLSPPGRG
jgi:hypothetical protein